MKTIVIGCDHAGYELKEHVKKYLLKQGYDVVDKGTHSSESVDYPDYVHPLAEDVSKDEKLAGITICGSGNGAAMAANKHKNIRAALCWNKELAALARQHNDANVLSIPARFISKKMSIELVKTFLSTSFDGGRHKRRVDKISFCGTGSDVEIH